MNKNILIGLLIFVISIGGWVLLGQKQENKKSSTPIPTASLDTSAKNPAVQPSTALDENANWKTYTNEAQRYSFKYPSTWIAEESQSFPENILQQVVMRDPANQNTFSFFIEVEKNRTYEQIVSRLHGGADATLRSSVERKETINVGGLPATKVVFNTSQSDGQGNYIDTGKSILVVVNRDRPLEIVWNDISQEKLLDQILSTFKFIQ